MGGGGKRNSKKKMKEKSNHSNPKPVHGQPEILNVGGNNEILVKELYEKVKLQYEKALEKLIALDYSKDVASRAILMNGCVYGPSSTISDNIVGNCISYIETGRVIDARLIRGSGKPIFKDLEEAVTCSMHALIDVAIKNQCTPPGDDEVIKTLVSDKRLFPEDQFSDECSNSKVLQKQSENLMKESLDSFTPQTGICAQETDRISVLTHELDKLTEQLNQTKTWAHETVIQTANRLSHDLMELHKLRFEKAQTERLKKEKQERSSRNETKLAEMEHMLRKFNCDVSRMTGYSNKLETDNLAMKADISASRFSASENESALRLVEKEEKRYLRMLKNNENQVYELKRQIDEEKQDISKREEKLHKAREAEKNAKLRHIQEVEAKKQARLLFLEEERLNKKAKEESRRRLEAVRQELDAAKKQLIHKKKASGGGVIISNKYSCLICCEKMANVLLLPCNHLVICEDCNAISSNILADGCPCCEEKIENKIKVYGHS